MSKERLSHFYLKLKEVQPSILDLKNAGYDEKTSIVLSKIFNIEIKNNEIIFEIDLFRSFFKSFNVKGFSPSNWVFKDESSHYSLDGYIIFGFSDTEKLALYLSTGEIRLLDGYDIEIFYPLAPSFDSFLDVILIETKYDKIGYLNLPFTNEMRVERRKELTKILKTDYYLNSYFTEYDV